MHGAIFYLATCFPVLMVLAGLALWKNRRRTTSTSEPQAVVRTASLNTATENGQQWWFRLLPTLLLLGGTASLLAGRWQTIPERYPIHWSISGKPNGWANRSFGSVFGLLILASVLVVAFGLLGDLIARSSPGYKDRSSMIATTRTILTACSWFVTILLCSISLLPLTHDPTNLVPLLLLSTLVFSLGIIGYVAYRSTRMVQTIAAAQNSTDSRFWKAGLIYYNPDDSALMVPKREGFGYTLNFGRPVCWFIFGAILLLPLLLPFFIHISRNH